MADPSPSWHRQVFRGVPSHLESCMIKGLKLMLIHYIMSENTVITQFTLLYRCFDLLAKINHYKSPAIQVMTMYEHPPTE